MSSKMAQGSFHDCCTRFTPHRVDAAARPNMYPDWPETPEPASILVNHTRTLACVLPRVSRRFCAYCSLWIPGLDLVGTSSEPVDPSLPVLLCGTADFTGQKPRAEEGSDRPMSRAFFFLFPKHFRAGTDGVCHFLLHSTFEHLRVWGAGAHALIRFCDLRLFSETAVCETR
jgi:hypothetical protein